MFLTSPVNTGLYAVGLRRMMAFCGSPLSLFMPPTLFAARTSMVSESKANQDLMETAYWLGDQGLTLKPAKSKVVLLIKLTKCAIIMIEVEVDSM